MSMWEKDGMSRQIFLKMWALWTTAAALGAANEALATKARSKTGPDEFDAIIIGSGLGGLACAGYLAKRGLKALVVEQRAIPGGYATNFSRAAGRFTFDASLHHIVIHGVCKQVLEELHVLDRVKFHECDQLFRVVAQDLDVTCPSKGPKGLEQLLVGMFPEEERGIKGFVADLVGLSEEVDRILAARKDNHERRANLPEEYPLLMAGRNKTLADYLNAHVSNPKLRAILSSSCGSFGLPPDTLSGFYYMTAFGSRVRHGTSYPEGGSQAISHAMAEFIENHGGELRFKTRVEKVLVQEGRAVGVLTSDGETIRARAVVANGSAATLFNEMIDPDTLPRDYRERIRSFKPSMSSFIVWLALNKDITAQIRDAYISLNPGPAGTKTFHNSLRGDMEKASLGVCIYNNIYRTYSPPGTTVMTIVSLCGYQPFQPFEKDYVVGEKVAYKKKKAEIAQAMIKRVEDQLIPGLSGMIQVQVAATPLTNVRYTLNTAGAIYGYEQSVANTFMNRISNRTPVEGLYLAGAWGEPGGGYAPALSSGKKTFGMLMQDWKQA
jgi:phytoene dehydrogenase-like protein